MKGVASKRGAARRYNAILRRCRLDFRGGLQFGMDMPTIAATFPDRYAELLEIKKLYLALPE